MTDTDISEKYQKYLVEITYQGASWFSVTGTDAIDNDADKILVDKQGRILLFANREDLRKHLLNTNDFFDSIRLQAWAVESNNIVHPYALLNLDVLLGRNINVTRTPLLLSIYIIIGIVEDYAVQVNNRDLIHILGSDTIRLHQDIFADYFLWSPAEEFGFNMLPDIFSDATKTIFSILEPCILTNPSHQAP